MQVWSSVSHLHLPVKYREFIYLDDLFYSSSSSQSPLCSLYVTQVVSSRVWHWHKHTGTGAFQCLGGVQKLNFTILNLCVPSIYLSNVSMIALVIVHVLHLGSLTGKDLLKKCICPLTYHCFWSVTRAIRWISTVQFMLILIQHVCCVLSLQLALILVVWNILSSLSNSSENSRSQSFRFTMFVA